MPCKRTYWTIEEDFLLSSLVDKCLESQEGKGIDWKAVASNIPDREAETCRKRWRLRCSNESKNFNRGTWSPEEDELLKEFMKSNLKPEKNVWVAAAEYIKTRKPDQCSKRWKDALDPNIIHTQWSEKEDEALFNAYQRLGSQWSEIRYQYLPNRPNLDLKNRMDHLSRLSKYKLKERTKSSLTEGKELSSDQYLSSRAPIDLEKTTSPSRHSYSTTTSARSYTTFSDTASSNYGVPSSVNSPISTVDATSTQIESISPKLLLEKQQNSVQTLAYAAKVQQSFPDDGISFGLDLHESLDNSPLWPSRDSSVLTPSFGGGHEFNEQSSLDFCGVELPGLDPCIDDTAINSNVSSIYEEFLLSNPLSSNDTQQHLKIQQGMNSEKGLLSDMQSSSNDDGFGEDVRFWQDLQNSLRIDRFLHPSLSKTYEADNSPLGSPKYFSSLRKTADTDIQVDSDEQEDGMDPTCQGKNDDTSSLALFLDNTSNDCDSNHSPKQSEAFLDRSLSKPTPLQVEQETMLSTPHSNEGLPPTQDCQPQRAIDTTIQQVNDSDRVVIVVCSRASSNEVLRSLHSLIAS